MEDTQQPKEPENEIELAILEVARSFEQGRWDGCYQRVKDILNIE